jgi:hypothetical protein
VLRGYLVDERADSPERQSRYRVSPEQAEQALGGDGGGDNGSVGGVGGGDNGSVGGVGGGDNGIVGGDGGGLGCDGGEKKQAASDEIGL